MKIKILVLLFLFSANITIGQKKVAEHKGPKIPLVEYFSYKYNYDKPKVIPKDVYFKDINGDLNPFLGTWKGVYKNKNYEFVVVKKSKYFGDMLMDVLEMRYKITDTSGNVILNILDFSSLSPLVIDGSFLALDKKDYVFRYRGYEIECGQAGTVTFAKVLNNPNKMRISLNAEGMYPTCPLPVEVEQILPVGAGAILIKQ